MQKIQEIDPNGNVVWDFIYSSSSVLSHHDICLIGDKVLLSAWEVKSQAELLNAGFTGNVLTESGQLILLKLREIQIQAQPKLLGVAYLGSFMSRCRSK